MFIPQQSLGFLLLMAFHVPSERCRALEEPKQAEAEADTHEEAYVAGRGDDGGMGIVLAWPVVFSSRERI